MVRRLDAEERDQSKTVEDETGGSGGDLGLKKPDGCTEFYTVK